MRVCIYIYIIYVFVYVSSFLLCKTTHISGNIFVLIRHYKLASIYSYNRVYSGAADLLSATEGDKANKKPVPFEDVARYELYVGFLFGRGVLVVYFYQEVTNPSPCRAMAMLCRP